MRTAKNSVNKRPQMSASDRVPSSPAPRSPVAVSAARNHSQPAFPARKVLASNALLPLHEGIVYGPVRSRRFGRSLGINLTPAHVKLCTFNCSYCQYGWTHQPRRGSLAAEGWPPTAMVVRAVAAAIRLLQTQGERFDRLTLAGHGEPTLHPQFADVVDALVATRQELAPGIPLVILSNATTVDRPEVRDALMRLDERHMKLDAGDQAILRAVNGSAVPLEQLIQGLQQLPQVVIQTMFVKDRLGRVDNSTDLAVTSWIGALRRIDPIAVHVYTVDRATAWPYLQAVPGVRLREIAHRVKLAGLTCEVFGVNGNEQS